MTIEEKFWQLFMLPGQPGSPGEDYSHGIFGLQIPPAATARADAERINAAQRHVLTRTRLGIPMMPFEEAVHGLRRPGATMFPQAIAREARTRGIRQVRAPARREPNPTGEILPWLMSMGGVRAATCHTSMPPKSSNT